MIESSMIELRTYISLHLDMDLGKNKQRLPAGSQGVR